MTNDKGKQEAGQLLMDAIEKTFWDDDVSINGVRP